MRYLVIFLVSLLLVAACSSAGGPDPDRDRWLLPLMFGILGAAMFKFAEMVIKWWRNRGDGPKP